ncbi:unnamed protein product [Pipistrellus nathusii]|uniref:Uncharacterized protein n=1 Tax=Pipistrellus nathusii TaxID=59473 RepID=A0ABP0AM42_PIPNA
MTPGAVMPACPLAQRGFGRCPGNGPFGTLAEPKDQIAPTGDTHRLARDPKRLRGAPKRPPIRRTPSPPSVTSSPRGDGRRGICPPSSVPPLSSSPRVSAIRPGSPLTPVPRCGRPSRLFPRGSPHNRLQRTPLVPPCHQLETPPTRRTPCHRVIAAAPFASGSVRLDSSL